MLTCLEIKNKNFAVCTYAGVSKWWLRWGCLEFEAWLPTGSGLPRTMRHRAFELNWLGAPASLMIWYLKISGPPSSSASKSMLTTVPFWGYELFWEKHHLWILISQNRSYPQHLGYDQTIIDWFTSFVKSHGPTGSWMKRFSLVRLINAACTSWQGSFYLLHTKGLNHRE